MKRTFFHIIPQTDVNKAIDLLRELTLFPEEMILKLMDSKSIAIDAGGENGSYYESQLSRVNPHLTEYPPTVKIYANGNGDNTNNLSLNNESAKALIQWLKYNFPNCED